MQIAGTTTKKKENLAEGSTGIEDLIKFEVFN
jgi:hypothetical protein